MEEMTQLQDVMQTSVQEAQNPAPANSEDAKKGKKGGRLRGAALFVCGGLVGAAVSIGALYVHSGGTLFYKSFLSSESMAKLQTLYQMIEKHYYKSDELTEEQLADGLYKGLLESLDDPYSTYYTAEEMTKLDESISGSYSGIGAYVSKDTTTGYPKIAGVISGAPAEKVGLMADDILYEADGESLQDMDLDVAVSKIRGEKGTTVHLTIVRDGELMEFDVTRDEVTSTTVEGKMLEDGIGYLYISEFKEVTPEQFEEQLKTLQDENDLKGLVIDLRNNPGGTVDAVTSIAEYLIPEGLVFYMQYPDGSTKEYSTDGSNYIGIPITVLVNGNSASASEILSSAIQDSGAGKVVGTQSYGKGVVQTAYTMTDGTAVKLTICEYFTRNGNTINKVGVTPDEVVEFDSEAYAEDRSQDNQLQAAVELLKEETQ